ncbi:unnamed protein product [Lactuca saligna]|uniref:non-specific serine/threonine protein kinase n=1 Tax=Lactuca saligna TaxID=75948 RepID=A0AA35Z8L8_LACSI|nr:unnamed protein product [Lactuca saligna]
MKGGRRGQLLIVGGVEGVVTHHGRTLTVSALGADTFEGTTLAVIGGDSVAAIAAVISLAEPETRRQLQAEEVVGAGAVNKVYKGFDQEEGMDVAWNQVKLRSFGGDPSVLKRLFSEIKLLQTLENENIIVLYSFRKDTKNSTLNFITYACASAICFNGSQFRPLIPLLEAMPKELGTSLHDMLNLITVKYIEHIEKNHMEPEECYFLILSE